MPSLTFASLLLYLTPLLTVIYLISLRYSTKGDLRNSKSAKLLGCKRFQYSLLILFVATSAATMMIGERPVVYFILMALLAPTTLLYVFRRSGSRMDGWLLMLISLSAGITVLVTNDLHHFGTDQGRDYGWSLQISEAGGWSELKTPVGWGYYTTFPVLPVLMSMLHIIAVLPMPTYVILTPLAGGIMVTSVYLLYRAVTKDRVGAFLAGFVFLATPVLSFIYLAPRNFTFVYSLLFLYLLFRRKRQRDFKSIILGILFLIMSTVTHGSGIALIYLFTIPWFINILRGRWRILAKKLTTMALLATAVAFTYWGLRHVMLKTILGPFEDLLDYVLTYIAGGVSTSFYEPKPYLTGGPQPYALAWINPVALTASLILDYILRLRRIEKPGEFSILTTSFLALSVVMVVFFAINVGHTQYFVLPVFMALAVTSSYALARIVKTSKNVVRIIVLSLFTTAVFVGVCSPDWAPLENPGFSRKLATPLSRAEAKMIDIYLPEDIILTRDYDISLTRRLEQYWYEIRDREDLILLRIEEGHNLLHFEKNSGEAEKQIFLGDVGLQEPAVSELPFRIVFSRRHYFFALKLKRFVKHINEQYNVVSSTGLHIIVVSA